MSYRPTPGRTQFTREFSKHAVVDSVACRYGREMKFSIRPKSDLFESTVSSETLITYQLLSTITFSVWVQFRVMSRKFGISFRRCFITIADICRVRVILFNFGWHK